MNQRAGGQCRNKHPERARRLRKNEEVLKELQDNMKPNNICITGVPEGEEEHGIENLFEKVMMKNFPNLVERNYTSPENIDSQARGTQRGRLQDTS